MSESDVLKELRELRDLLTPAKREAPTLAEFAPRFIQRLVADNHKASGIGLRRLHLRKYLLPLLGTRRLDEITSADIDALKVVMNGLSASSMNSVLATIRRILHVAVEGGILESIRVRFSRARVGKPREKFYTFEQLDTLFRASAQAGPREHAMVLMGAHAGMRRGEMLALEWPDISGGHVHIQRNVIRGIVGLPKSNRTRSVPLSRQLAAALDALRPAGDATGRVLLNNEGAPATEATLRGWMGRVQRRAGLKDVAGGSGPGALHILRHTFCTHLASRGVSSAKLMQLAGHRTLAMAEIYLHVMPGELERAIATFDEGAQTR